MHPNFDVHNTGSWVAHSIWFCKAHFVIIFSLGLVAAFGRAIQLGAFGPVTSPAFILLEVVIESARVIIFLYALGFTHIKTGFFRLVHVFSSKASFRKNRAVAFRKLKRKWAVIVLNIAVFLVMAAMINYLIDLLAYQTCLYAQLKAGHVIVEQASEWTIILFFKNISVIPFTLVCIALFLLWLTNKQPDRWAYRPTPKQ